MKVIGITGTSGAGKTTLSQILDNREDVGLIDADKVAREMAKPGNDYLKEIRKVFGEEYFLEDENLNRKKLASKIYNDKNALDKLNKLTFKYVVKEILNKIQNYKNTKKEFIVIDAALLLESELDKYCDIVISLIADEELKIKRICKRDNVSKEIAKGRLKIQNDDSYYIEKSNYVIYNNEDCDLELEIEKILELIKEGK